MSVPVTSAAWREALAALPRAERESLAEFLWETLDDEFDDDVKAAWLLVAQRRLEELRSGKVRGIPAEEVFAQRPYRK